MIGGMTFPPETIWGPTRNLCHGEGIDFPAVGDGVCCSAAAMFGPDRCTCWEPVFDLEQQPANEEALRLLAAGLTLSTRDTMCGDCAYRPNSPEKQGDPNYAASGPGELDELARNPRSQFTCHVGTRRPLKWRHVPSGVEIQASPADYRPPIVKVNGHEVPLKADGNPAELCAGFAARRKALQAADAKQFAAEAGEA